MYNFGGTILVPNVCVYFTLFSVHFRFLDIHNAGS